MFKVIEQFNDESVEYIDKKKFYWVTERKKFNNFTLLSKYVLISKNNSNIEKKIIELLEQNKDINYINEKNNYGMTALMYASMYNNYINEKIFDILIKYKANVNEQNNQGMTALMLACKYSTTTSNIEIIKKLLNNGARTDILTRKNNNILSLISKNIYKSSSIETLKIILNKINKKKILIETMMQNINIFSETNNNINISKIIFKSIFEKHKNILEIVKEYGYDTDILIKYVLLYFDIKIIDELLNIIKLKNTKLSELLIMIVYSTYLSNDEKKEKIKLLLKYNADLNKEYDIILLLNYISKDFDFEFIKFMINNENISKHINKYILSELIIFNIYNIKDYQKQIQICELILEKGIDINYQDKKKKMSMLMYACYFSDIRMVKYLLNKKNINVNLYDKDNSTCLKYICNKKLNNKENEINKNILILLIKNGININHQDNEKKTALMYACQYKNHDIIKILIKNIADINLEDNFKKTALFYSCECEDIYTIKLLIKCGANINHCDYRKKTILINICSNNKINLLDVVLKNNVNIDFEDYNNKTALIYACENLNYDMICKLIEHGADVNYTTKYGQTALMYTCKIDKNEKNLIIDLLIKNKAIINIVDSYNWSPLELYINRTNEENINDDIIEKLLILKIQTYKLEIEHLSDYIKLKFYMINRKNINLINDIKILNNIFNKNNYIEKIINENKICYKPNNIKTLIKNNKYDKEEFKNNKFKVIC